MVCGLYNPREYMLCIAAVAAVYQINNELCDCGWTRAYDFHIVQSLMCIAYEKALGIIQPGWSSVPALLLCIGAFWLRAL